MHFIILEVCGINFSIHICIAILEHIILHASINQLFNILSKYLKHIIIELSSIIWVRLLTQLQRLLTQPAFHFELKRVAYSSTKVKY